MTKTKTKLNFSGVKSLLDGYIDQGKFPGYALLVSQACEEIGYMENGKMDVERNKPVVRNTLYRIYSMTKPVTSVAMMQLWEKGLFKLDDPVYEYIPSWKNLKVFEAGTAEDYTTKSPDRHMTIKDLLTHTSGLSYGFNQEYPVDQLYHIHGLYMPRDITLAEGARRLGDLPLCFSPGSRWNYSLATDVIGYLIELLSRESLDVYFNKHIFQPLEMDHTGFFVQPEHVHRFAACYQYVSGGARKFELQDDPETSPFLTKPKLSSGGGGLISSIDDYHVFCKAMSGKGEYQGVKLLEAETVALMTSNQLPGNKDLAAMGQSTFTETIMDGVGFGLGYSVLLDPVRAKVSTSKGEFAWGGMASTYHWIDPQQDIIAILMTQLLPSSAYPIRSELKNALLNQEPLHK